MGRRRSGTAAGGGGGAPTGAAGGDLAGTYPNPTVKASVALTGTPTGVTNGTASDASTQLATNAFVQNAIAASGAFDSKPPVDYASAAALPANTYANGTSGVGATLTGNANGPLVIDGVTILVGQIGRRVLVTAEAAPANNGWYTITQQGVVAVSPYILTRATESDQAAEIGSGYITSVIAPNGVTVGTANNGKAFVSVAAADPFVVGTTGLTFSTVGNAVSAGAGITVTGSSVALSAQLSAPAVTGLWYKRFTPVTGVAAAGTTSKLYAYRVLLAAGTLVRIGFSHFSTNGGAGEVMRLGLYSDSGGRPGALLLDAGTVALDSAAGTFKTITIAQVLTVDTWVWLAGVQQVSNTAVLLVYGNAGSYAMSQFGAVEFDASITNGNGYTCATQTGVTGALPNPMVPVMATDDAHGPQIGVRY